MILPSIAPHNEPGFQIVPMSVFFNYEKITTSVQLSVQAVDFRAPYNTITDGCGIWAVGSGGTGAKQRIADDVMISEDVNLVPSSSAAEVSSDTVGINILEIGGKPVVLVRNLLDLSTPGSQSTWVWCKTPRFFDAVRYTGNGNNSITVLHNLGIQPGVIMVKRKDAAGAWAVYHNEVGATDYLTLDTDDAKVADSTYWVDVEPTAESFTVGAALNENGGDYIAFVFANDVAGDGYMRTGTYTGNGTDTGPFQELGWRPEWVMIKRTDSGGDWKIYDDKRQVGDRKFEAINANTSARDFDDTVTFTTLGFQKTIDGVDVLNIDSATYVWLAWRSNRDFYGGEGLQDVP